MSRQRRYHGANRTALMLAIFATFLLVAATASASSDTTRNFSQDIFNACNGETIPSTGNEHIVDNTTSNSNNTNFNFMQSYSGKGVGSISGAQYTVGDQMHVHMKVPSGPATFRQWTKAISQGNNPAAPNFMVQAIFHVNGDGSHDTTHFDSKCN